MGGSRRADVGRWLSVALLAASLGCASGGGKSGHPVSPPDFVKTQGPCWVGGRITLDQTLLPTTSEDELANLTCDNLVIVQKSEDGSTKLVHADGNFAHGYGECRYQFPDVPPGTSSYSGRVVALSVPESRYALSSAGGIQYHSLWRDAGLPQPAAGLRPHHSRRPRALGRSTPARARWPCSRPTPTATRPEGPGTALSFPSATRPESASTARH